MFCHVTGACWSDQEGCDWTERTKLISWLSLPVLPPHWWLSQEGPGWTERTKLIGWLSLPVLPPDWWPGQEGLGWTERTKLIGWLSLPVLPPDWWSGQEGPGWTGRTPAQCWGWCQLHLYKNNSFIFFIIPSRGKEVNRCLHNAENAKLKIQVNWIRKNSIKILNFR